jgi:hypothetical protein
VGGSPLIGPAVANIPGLRNVLPPGQDPIRGRELVNEHPLERQLTGLSRKGIEPFEQMITENGLRIGDLIGNTANPEIQNLMRKHMGIILNQSVDKNGTTVHRAFAQRVSSIPNISEEARRELIREFFTAARNDAEKSAIEEAKKLNNDNLIVVQTPNGEKFLEDFLATQPEHIRIPFLKELRNARERKTNPK